MRPAMGGHLAMLAFSALVAGSFALGARAANEIDPLVMTAARFWIASAVLAGLAFAFGTWDNRVLRAPWRFVLLSGIISAYFVSMFEGLKTAPPISTSAVFTLTPIIAAGFGWLLLRQRLTGRMVIALTIGGFGALWVIFRADLQTALAFDVGRGEVIFFWGCVAHALYTPLIAKLKRGEHTLSFACMTLLGGAILTSIYGAREIIATDWMHLPGIVWITLMYVALFASASSFVLLQFAATRLPSAKVMAYTYLTPTWVICWQLALGAPPPPQLILVGIALTILALILLLRDDDAPKAAVAPS